MAHAAPSAGFVPDRPDLGHFAGGRDLADAAFFAEATDAFEPRLLPSPAYVALAFADLEDDAVWTRAWLCIGVQDEIPRAGDLLPHTAGHHGIHVQREADGGLVGRFNKAQHGGCRAVPLQCRTGTKTRCSFTACGYSYDGGPLAAGPNGPTPAMHQYLGLRPERLLPVAVHTWGPLIFANLDSRAGAGPAGTMSQHPIVPAGDGAVLRRVEYAANWKLLAQHLADGRVIAAEPGCLRLATILGDGASAEIRLVFPNLVLISVRDQTCAVILQPTAVGRTLCRVALFGADTAAWAAWLSEIAGRAAAAEAAQVRIAATSSDAGPVSINAAGHWIQTEIAGRVLSRPDAGLTEPLYATAQGRRR